MIMCKKTLYENSSLQSRSGETPTIVWFANRFNMLFLYRRGAQQSMNRAVEESNNYIAQKQKERQASQQNAERTK